MTGKASTSSYTLYPNLDTGVWRGSARFKGAALAKDDPAAHEFGHLLGLRDRYHHGEADPGWYGNIMAMPANQGHVNQGNIDPLVQYTLKQSGGKSGTYVHDYHDFIDTP